MLFDLDGVLVDSRAAICNSIQHALAAAAPGVVPERPLERYIGEPLAVAFADLTGAEPDSERVAACIAAYRERYATRFLEETRAVPGIAEMLATLGRRRTLAVATSKPAAFAGPLLETLGLRELFAAVAGPSLADLQQSKATVIASALDELGRPGAVMVGDRAIDVRGACANGLATVAVSWGIGTRDELAGAAALVDSPDELPAAVDRLLDASARGRDERGPGDQQHETRHA